MMKEFPLSKVFHLIEPGPLVMVTTARKGKANVMTMSWHLMMEFTPPLIGCVVSSLNYSFAALRATKECVIAIPAVDMAKTVVDIGNCSGKDTDKFQAFGVTRLSAEKVKAPLIAECLANLECRVVDTVLVNKYNFFVLKVVKAWHDPKRKERRTIHANGDGTFVIDGRTIDLKKRMVKFQSLI
jgi:flavin reductase (DIM6/NTAB) family NADH-FMN oxidoreductase RutF